MSYMVEKITRLIVFTLLFFFICVHTLSFFSLIISIDAPFNDCTKVPYTYPQSWNYYVTSIYFTVTTLTTVGYGTPNASNEGWWGQLYIMFFEFAGILFYGLTMTKINTIVHLVCMADELEAEAADGFETFLMNIEKYGTNSRYSNVIGSLKKLKDLHSSWNFSSVLG